MRSRFGILHDSYQNTKPCRRRSFRVGMGNGADIGRSSTNSAAMITSVTGVLGKVTGGRLGEETALQGRCQIDLEGDYSFQPVVEGRMSDATGSDHRYLVRGLAPLPGSWVWGNRFPGVLLRSTSWYLSGMCERISTVCAKWMRIIGEAPMLRVFVVPSPCLWGLCGERSVSPDLRFGGVIGEAPMLRVAAGGSGGSRNGGICIFIDG